MAQGLCNCKVTETKIGRLSQMSWVGPILSCEALKAVNFLQPEQERREVQRELKPERDVGCSYKQRLVPRWQLARKWGTQPTAARNRVTTTTWMSLEVWASPPQALEKWQPDFSLVRPSAQDPAELGCAHISKLCKCYIINECCFKALVCGDLSWQQ